MALKKVDYRVRQNPDDSGYFVEVWNEETQRWRCVAHRIFLWSARRLAAKLAQNRPLYIEEFPGLENPE